MYFPDTLRTLYVSATGWRQCSLRRFEICDRLSSLAGCRYLKFVMYMIIWINWMSCALYMTACPPYLLSRQRVASLQSAHGQYCIENSWVMPLINHDTATLSELYVNSSYFAIVTFTTVGFGDYHANNYNEVCDLSRQQRLFLCGRHDRQRYTSRPSVRPSVRLSSVGLRRCKL